MHVWNNSAFSDVCFANIVNPSMAGLFIPLTVSFTEQVFLILMKLNLSIISYMDHTFGIISKKSPINWSLYRFFSCYLLEVFIVLPFIFSSIIHFPLISKKGVRSCLDSHFFTCRCPVVPGLLVGKLSLLHYITFAPKSKIS